MEERCAQAGVRPTLELVGTGRLNEEGESCAFLTAATSWAGRGGRQIKPVWSIWDLEGLSPGPHLTQQECVWLAVRGYGLAGFRPETITTTLWVTWEVRVATHSKS